ncbi:MAG TPA: 4-(cytidine 5'-diphospho)-2-C-methyl-D-erythritol kinase [Acidimicrobiia bacterium]
MNGAAIARAGAKVTLSLRVLNRRPDGYHELDALAAIVDEPHDELSIIPGAHEAELLVEPAGSAPHGEANLLWRTRAALGSTAGLRLRKGIPTEAGLGGGSADAAAALRLLRTTQADAELHDIAASLGADVPACLEGGLVRMRGIGDIVEPVAVPASPLHLVLATPAFGCSTAAVYRAWDTLGGPHTDDHVEPPPAWARVSGGNVWQNDLEPAAIAVEPRLADFRNAFGALAGTRVTQCGSGSTYYAIAADRARAEQVADAVRAELDTRGVAVATVGTTAS